MAGTDFGSPGEIIFLLLEGLVLWKGWADTLIWTAAIPPVRGWVYSYLTVKLDSSGEEEWSVLGTLSLSFQERDNRPAKDGKKQTMKILLFTSTWEEVLTTV